MKTKKLLILWVLILLSNESDESNPMTQAQIAREISTSANYTCDRKTVGRNIKVLMEMGYPIRKTAKGFYMDKKLFSVDEVKFISDAILSCDKMPQEQRQALAEKVVYALGKMYRR